MDNENQPPEKDVIRIDIVKALSLFVLIASGMVMLLTGIALTICMLYLFDVSICSIAVFYISTVFCLALITFVIVYKKVFANGRGKFVDVEFNRK
ncbi:hypothetical protein FACS189419_00930 [Planctomycetales bacterium]|nr:hypothetical protein FACS189419_00930 [Planctomycetales bacterium]